MFLEVTKAEYINDFKIFLKFNDDISKTVDLKNELMGEIFQPLRDKNYFKTFSIKFNTIEWDNGAGFAPEYLYQIGEKDGKKSISREGKEEIGTDLQEIAANSLICGCFLLQDFYETGWYGDAEINSAGRVWLAGGSGNAATDCDEVTEQPNPTSTSTGTCFRFSKLSKTTKPTK